MKRIICILLALVMVLGLAACGSSKEEQAPAYESAKALLEAVWNNYSENDKFPAMGGDFNEENITDGAPGNYSLEGDEVAGAVLNSFAMPESCLPMIDDAASLMHMMNLNSFSCGAFHLSDGSKAEDFAKAMEEGIQNNMWICGFPDKLYIAQVGDYMISLFGNEELVATFISNLTKTCEDVKVHYEEAIM